MSQKRRAHRKLTLLEKSLFGLRQAEDCLALIFAYFLSRKSKKEEQICHTMLQKFQII
jgi:hypothetical protein